MTKKAVVAVENPQGPGTKVSIYVPPEDFSVLKQVDMLIDDLRTAGYRSSRSFEVVRLLKVGLGQPDVRLDAFRKQQKR